MVSRIFLVVVLAVFSDAACSDQATKTDFVADAKALCDAFNPVTWSVDFQKLSPSEKAMMLQQKIQAAIHSEPMKRIYQGLVTDTPQMAYSNYTQNVSDLLGEQHTCPSIKNYFSFSTAAYAHEESKGSVMFMEKIQKLISATNEDSEEKALGELLVAAKQTGVNYGYRVFDLTKNQRVNPDQINNVLENKLQVIIFVGDAPPYEEFIWYPKYNEHITRLIVP